MDVKGFNLIDNPFLPCLDGTGKRVVLSLKEILSNAHELSLMSGDSPIQTASLWRLLLVILYAALTLEQKKDWAVLGGAGKLPMEKIGAYLERWHERFYLFHPERPFFQSPGLEKYFVPIQKLFPERAAGNNDTLFDHTHRDSGFSVEAGAAARGIITAQAFSVGGLVSAEKKEEKSAQAGAIASAMVLIVPGKNVFETLLRNLTQYNQELEEPFCSTRDDLPAWERPLARQPGERVPDGLRDYMTFQSRRILLQPFETAEGELRCGKVAILKGDSLHPQWSGRDRDPYVAFRRFEGAENARDQWLPLRLDPNRAVWRDSAALFTPRSKDGANTRRPLHFTWLGRLAGLPGFVGNSFEVTAYGQATDQASVLMWRAERLTLPLVFLENRSYSAELQLGLAKAETAAVSLRGAIKETLESLGMKSPKAVPHLAQAQTCYWAALEPGFRKFLTDLASILVDEAESFGGQEEPVIEAWSNAIWVALMMAFEDFEGGLSSSARTLQAVTKGKRRLATVRFSGVRRQEAVRNDGNT